jgi:hypothetical protein
MIGEGSMGTSIIVGISETGFFCEPKLRIQEILFGLFITCALFLSLAGSPSIELLRLMTGESV